MKRFVIGDIHGEYDRMLDVLEKSGFDPERDELYSTGDLCDRGPKPVEVLDHLYSLPHFFPVVGNHDLWLRDYFLKKLDLIEFCLWIENNGGEATVYAVNKQTAEWKAAMEDRISSAPFARTVGDYIICHAGIGELITKYIKPEKFLDIPNKDIDRELYNTLYEEVIWGREQLYEAMKEKKAARTYGHRIIIGHTPVKKPFVTEDGNLVAIDTGSFVSSGCITVMDIDTGEFFHSTTPTDTVISNF